MLYILGTGGIGCGGQRRPTATPVRSHLKLKKNERAIGGKKGDCEIGTCVGELKIAVSRDWVPRSIEFKAKFMPTLLRREERDPTGYDFE